MITESDVTKFAIASRKKNLFEALKNKYRDVILKGLLAGEHIPLTGPYTVGLSQNGGKDFSWEQAYENLQARILRERFEYTKEESHIIAREKMAKLMAKAPDKEVVRINGEAYIGGVKLTPKVNAKHKEKSAEVEAVA
jgi:hypothetical protein